jgi:hypothetical protein
MPAGIIPRAGTGTGTGRKCPREHWRGRGRGIPLPAGTGVGSYSPTGNSRLPSLPANQCPVPPIPIPDSFRPDSLERLRAAAGPAISEGRRREQRRGSPAAVVGDFRSGTHVLHPFPLRAPWRHPAPSSGGADRGVRPDGGRLQWCTVEKGHPWSSKDVAGALRCTPVSIPHTHTILFRGASVDVLGTRVSIFRWDFSSIQGDSSMVITLFVNGNNNVTSGLACAPQHTFHAPPPVFQFFLSLQYLLRHAVHECCGIFVPTEVPWQFTEL